MRHNYETLSSLQASLFQTSSRAETRVVDVRLLVANKDRGSRRLEVMLLLSFAWRQPPVSTALPGDNFLRLLHWPGDDFLAFQGLLRDVLCEHKRRGC